MKKLRFLGLALVVIALGAGILACSDDDNDNSPVQTQNVLEQQYFSIDDATYHSGAFPTETEDEDIEGLSINSQALTGGMNFVSIVTEDEYEEFYFGVEGVDGYLASAASEESETRAGGYHSYVIIILYSTEYNTNITMIISGKKKNGGITRPHREFIEHVDSESGALNLNLTFSNAKDVDMHLYMPDGTHIYYGDRGGTVWIDGRSVSYGLDHDSNAACRIDNLNNENIYIPAELVQSGQYRVVVDMYSNCDPSIATSWAIVARYEGSIIRVDSGSNPAMGVYPIGAGDGDMTTVMTFTIDNGTRGANASYEITPTPLTDSDKLKLEYLSYK